MKCPHSSNKELAISAFVLGEAKETKDPHFKKIAMTHADTVAANFIRADGSVRHIVEFDPETGAFVRDYGGQGYAQAPAGRAGRPWALYGL